MILKRFVGAKLIVIASFALIITIVSSSSIRVIHIEDAGCFSAECTAAQSKTAAKIKEYRNESITPCDNLYQHVCGNYKGSNIEQMYHAWVAEAEKRVKDLIEDASSKPEDFRPFKLIKDVFQTCMSEPAEQQSIKTLIDDVKSSWDQQINWIDWMLRSQMLGLDIKFLDIQPDPLIRDNTIYMSYIPNIAPDQFKKSIHNLSDPVVVAYSNYISQVLSTLGIEFDSERIIELIEFERKISEIHHRSYDGPYLIKINVEDLTYEKPSVDWTRLLSKNLISNIKKFFKIKNLSLMIPPSLFDYIDLLEKTPVRVQNNYATWKMVQSAVPFLNKNFRKAESDYYQSIKTKKTKTRVDSCIDVVKNYLRPAVTLLYAKKYYNREIEAVINEMVVSLKDQFTRSINQSTWLDQQTKKEGIQIIKNTPVLIGYDEKDKSDDDFVKYYEDLTIDTNNFMQTLRSLHKFDTLHRYNNATSLGPKVVVDPVKNFIVKYYSGNIYVPLASLQEPFFNISNPMYINYGIIGASIAHVLTKNIIHLGRKWVGDKEIDNEVISCFKRQLKPFENQAALQLLDSVDEEIKSHTSIKMAYLAYRNWVTKNKQESALPELSYSNNQLFWINSMQLFCMFDPTMTNTIDNKYNEYEYFIMRSMYDVPEFWEDFNCSKNESAFVKEYEESCTYL